MVKTTTIQKIQLLVIHSIAAAVLLPFLSLAAYCHPYFDDYGTALHLERDGFIRYFTSTYLGFAGRYSFLLANSIHPLRTGSLAVYQWMAGGLAAGLAASAYVTGWGLTAGTNLRRPARLAAGSGLVIAFLVLFPSPAEGFYWVIGGFNYVLPILVGLGGFAACAAYSAASSQGQRRWFLGVALVTAGLFPGFSEFSACLTLLLAGGLLLAFPQASRAYRVVALVGIAGAVAMLAAPGNLGRLHQTAHEWLVPKSIVLAGAATAYTLLNWLAFPAFWLLGLLGMPLWAKLSAGNGPAATLTRRPLLWPVLLVTGLLGCYLLSYLVIKQPMPLRARNILYVYFVFTGLLSVIGGVSWASRHGYALPQVPAPPLLLLLLLALLSDGNGRLRHPGIGQGLNTVGLAYRDWLSGDARQFDAAERSRYALLRTARTDSVAVPPLPVSPATLLYYDIGPTPGLWGNQVLGQYFGKKAVWVDWTQALPTKQKVSK